MAWQTDYKKSAKFEHQNTQGIQRMNMEIQRKVHKNTIKLIQEWP